MMSIYGVRHPRFESRWLSGRMSVYGVRYPRFESRWLSGRMSVYGVRYQVRVLVAQW